MRRLMTWVIIGSTVGVLAAGAAVAATAAGQQAEPATPKNFNYEIRDGKRVPKTQRVVNADGSWREEVRQGQCVIIKEMTAEGEYKESRRCE